MYYPILTDSERLSMLNIPKGKVDIVLDTDAYNEIDDQYAIVYALCSPDRINLRAIYAAPFIHPGFMNGVYHGEDKVEAGEGMEMSYQETLRLMGMMNIKTDRFVFRGADRFMENETTPVDNPATDDLIQKAKKYTIERPLVVVAIGAPTNIASAIVKEPDIIKNIVVIWQGGHALWWPNTDSYNLNQDLASSRVLLNSGVALWQVPAMGVAHQFIVSVPELEHFLGNGGPIARYLLENVKNYEKKNSKQPAYTKAIWDIGTIACLINESWMPHFTVHSPMVTDDLRWSHDLQRHMIRTTYHVERDIIINDLYHKIQNI